MEFRATKDVDIILIVEDRFPEFAVVFWEYIKNGGYRCGWKNSPGIHFYRLQFRTDAPTDTFVPS